MYITLPNTDLRIFIDDAQAHDFEDAYYPLDDNTAGVFFSSFSKEHRAQMDALLLRDPASQETADAITVIARDELSHALGLVDECSE